MNRLAQTALLFLLGATLLHAGTTDLYLRYVKEGLRPLVLLAGVVLIVTAAATLWYDRRGASTHDGGTPVHDHHREPRVSWLLTLPVLALILVAPPALGSYSATHTGTALTKPFGFPALPTGDAPLHLAVVDYAGRAIYDDGRALRDRELKITGFVTLDREGAPYLVRMGLNCCAADAQPVKIALTGNVPPVLRPDTWLEITGTYTPRRTKDPVNDGPIPYLEVTTARPVPTPHDPYDETWNT
ncbi:TIGR03943 family putative permease subunit [Streptomyces massasporeus]|uniref:TIGR03943 family putative permease subunit n=1 Tax=Streptomyces massasporeus TaxID=67324 RepID=UPI0016749C85|nr:TIGR03943 family protein [Streptomyces massasporeus]GGV82188.1 membrane protein [Streptomyces massasporeus]